MPMQTSSNTSAKEPLNFIYDTIIDESSKLSRAESNYDWQPSEQPKSEISNGLRLPTTSGLQQATSASSTSQLSFDLDFGFNLDTEVESIKQNNDRLVAQLVDSIRSSDKTKSAAKINDPEMFVRGRWNDKGRDDSNHDDRRPSESKRLIRKTIEDWILLSPLANKRNLLRGRV